MNLSPAAITVFRSLNIQGTHVRIAGQVDRTLYLEVDKALQALGGKWDRRAKAHTFAADPTDDIRRVTGDGSVVVPRDDLDFYPTPCGVAARVVELANIPAPDRGSVHVLEPSAGDGALLRPLLQTHPHVRVTAVEIDKRHVASLSGRGVVVLNDDFLAMSFRAGPPWHRIIMNPPFSRNRGIPHVQKAWTLLAPGGRLVTVLPASLTSRRDKAWAELRALFSGGGIETVPDLAFRESGTNVRTVIAWADKGVA